MPCQAIHVQGYSQNMASIPFPTSSHVCVDVHSSPCLRYRYSDAHMTSIFRWAWSRKTCFACLGLRFLNRSQQCTAVALIGYCMSPAAVPTAPLLFAHHLKCFWLEAGC